MHAHTVAKLPHPDKPSHVLVKHLESATVLFWIAGLAETAGAVEDFEEGVEVDCVIDQTRESNG